jgi:hypothetical protein
MSEFTNPLVLTMLPHRQWSVYEKFEYHVGQVGSGIVIRVPKGFKTDLASIPRIVWSILPPHGYYGKAAVIHDYCYENGIESKRWADDVLLEAMGVLGIPRWKKEAIYRAVRLFGRGNFKTTLNTGNR